MIEIQGDAGTACHRDQMHDGVRRPAKRHGDSNRVVEGRRRQQIPRLHVVPDELDDAAACGCGHSAVRGIRGGDRRSARQCQTQGFGRSGHRRCSPHRHTGAVRTSDAVFDASPGAVVDGAGTPLGPVLPDVAAAGQRLPFVVAAKHRAGRHEDRGKIHCRRTHDQAGHGLVAAAEQHHAIDRIRPQQLLGLHRQEIPIEHRRRLHQRFTERDNRHFDREPTRLPDTSLYLLGAQTQVRMTGIEVAPGVEDADHRLADVFLVGEAHLLGAGTVAERPQIVDAEPAMRSEGLRRASGHVRRGGPEGPDSHL